MGWRIEWTGGAGRVAPNGWAEHGSVAGARSHAHDVLAASPDADLRVVLFRSLDSGCIDIADARPDLATLSVWYGDADLPEPSLHTAAARERTAAERAADAESRLRTVLDHLVESGDVSRPEASRLVAAVTAAIIRSAAASAS